MSDWKSRAKPVTAPTSDWKSRALAVKEDAETEEPGMINTAITKLGAGASFGLDDELAGMISAAGRVAGVESLGGKFKDWGLAEDGPTLDLSEIKGEYEKTRDDIRKTKGEMDVAHPIASAISELAGSFAMPAGTAKTLAGRAAIGAAQGGVSAFGNSNADDPMRLLTDTAIGTTIGSIAPVGMEKVVMPAAGYTAKKAGQVGKFISEKAAPIVDWTLKKAGKVGANVPEEVTERYLQRSDAINLAKPLEDLAYEFKDEQLKKFQDHVGALDSIAWNTLSTNPSLDKDKILQFGTAHIRRILGGKKGDLTRISGTGADADAINAINSQLSEIADAYSVSLSESDLKSIVQSLQKLGYSLEGSPRTSIQGKAIRELSGVYNEVLKRLNAEYREAMVPVQQGTEALQRVQRQFTNQQAPGTIDKFLYTSKRLPRLSTDSEAVSGLRAMDAATGAGMENKILDRTAKDAFLKQDTNGSRKVLLGKAVGGALGAGAGYAMGEEGGAAVGAMAGFSADKYAGRIFKLALDGRIKGPEAIKNALLKSPQISNLYRNNPQAFQNLLNQLERRAGVIGNDEKDESTTDGALNFQETNDKQSLLQKASGSKYSQVLESAAGKGDASFNAAHFVLSQRDPEYRKIIGEHK